MGSSSEVLLRQSNGQKTAHARTRSARDDEKQNAIPSYQGWSPFCDLRCVLLFPFYPFCRLCIVESCSLCFWRCTVVQRGFCQDVVTIGHSSFSHFFRRSNAKVLILPAAHVTFLRSDIYLSLICTWDLRVDVVALSR